MDETNRMVASVSVCIYSIGAKFAFATNSKTVVKMGRGGKFNFIPKWRSYLAKIIAESKLMSRKRR